DLLEVGLALGAEAAVAVARVLEDVAVGDVPEHHVGERLLVRRAVAAAVLLRAVLLGVLGGAGLDRGVAVLAGRGLGRVLRRGDGEQEAREQGRHAVGPVPRLSPWRYEPSMAAKVK